MYTLLITIAVAFALVALAFVLLTLGRMITGKSKIRWGACGKDPKKLGKDEGCPSNRSCDLCEPPDEEKK